MSVLNQGRNDIRFNNSGGKCLLENWVEERAVEHIDPASVDGDFTSSAQIYKDGHRGVLTLGSGTESLTTFTDSYRPPVHPNVPQIGRKQVLMQQMLYEKLSKEVATEFDEPPQQEDLKSTTMADFNKPDFVSVKPTPTTTHDYKTEQPVTFWSEHRDRATGVSQVKTRDSAFRKNDGFSKPIDEYWDEPKPLELEQYPNM